MSKYAATCQNNFHNWSQVPWEMLFSLWQFLQLLSNWHHFLTLSLINQNYFGYIASRSQRDLCNDCWYSVVYHYSFIPISVLLFILLPRIPSIIYFSFKFRSLRSDPTELEGLTDVESLWWPCPFCFSSELFLCYCLYCITLHGHHISTQPVDVELLNNSSVVMLGVTKNGE